VSHRKARVAHELQRRLARILEEQVADPRLADVSVTGISVSPDLGFARVYFRTLGDRAQATEAFEKAAPFVRRRLGEGLHLRRVPELVFCYDESLDKAERIEEILRELKEDQG
jgi:ribosome-binding factor A